MRVLIAAIFACGALGAMVFGHREHRDYEIRYTITYTFPATGPNWPRDVDIVYRNLTSEQARW